jgi:hypothetical protein
LYLFDAFVFSFWNINDDENGTEQAENRQTEHGPVDAQHGDARRQELDRLHNFKLDFSSIKTSKLT